MAAFRKNHFVPQFYLRNFGTKKSIAVFNIAQGRFIPKGSIRKQCQREYLYGRTDKIEKALQKLEEQVANIIRCAIEKGELPKKETEEYVSLVVFIALQLSRSPVAGNMLQTAMTKMMRGVLRSDPRLPNDLKNHLDEVRMAHKNPVLLNMSMLSQYPYLLHDLKPALIQNDSNIGFIASESPAVEFNQWAQDVRDRGVLGMISSGLQIFLPLSSGLLLMLYDEEVYSLNKQVKLSAYGVHGINSLQLTTPVENLYFDGDQKTLDDIKKLPFDWHKQAQDAQRCVEAKAVNNPSSLVGNYREIVGRLTIPEIRIRTSAKGIPALRRGGRYRAEAKMALDLMGPIPGQGSGRFRVGGFPPAPEYGSFSIVRKS